MIRHRWGFGRDVDQLRKSTWPPSEAEAQEEKEEAQKAKAEVQDTKKVQKVPHAAAHRIQAEVLRARSSLHR